MVSHLFTVVTFHLSYFLMKLICNYRVKSAFKTFYLGLLLLLSRLQVTCFLVYFRVVFTAKGNATLL